MHDKKAEGGKIIDSPRNRTYTMVNQLMLTDDDGNVLNNVAGISFQEEQCGYLAGYAIVKEGFTKIGFSGGGGGTNPACCRYGYGYLQGASAAERVCGSIPSSLSAARSSSCL